MKAGDIEVKLGDTLGVSPLSTPSDPSGFFEGLHLRQGDIDALQSLVRELLDEILTEAPPLIQQIAGTKLSPLPLYAHTAPGRFQATSTNIWFRQVGISGHGLPAFIPEIIPPSSVHELLIGATADQIHGRDPALVSAVYHELGHGVTWDGVFTHSALHEAIALRLQNDRHPYPGFYATSLPWDVEHIQGDTGFSTDDMANFQRSRNANNAWYIATAHALDTISTEAVWRICSTLVDQAHQLRQTSRGYEKAMPLRREIHDAIVDELGQERAQGLLQTLAMRPMEEGQKTITFPLRGQATKEACFRVTQNPAYGELDSHRLWQGTQFLTEDF